jgi:Uri superfamily endonuclease
MAYLEFEFDLSDALLAHLVKVLNGLDPLPLTTEHVSELPEGQGVYQLFHNGSLVYIGKTDSEAGLPRRLARHVRSIQNRRNLNVEDVTFNAVRVLVFSAMDLETQLINHYGRPDWNFSGFGSNDPGRNRDRTRLNAKGFDARYPISVDRPLDFSLPDTSSAATLLLEMKQSLPYTLRFETAEKNRIPHSDLTETQISLPNGPKTVRSVMEAIISSLPPGWQATALPSRVLLYRENHSYAVEGGQLLGRSK